MAVTGDDWYQRRRQDDEGVFFRKMAAQGPQRGEGATRQGIYLFTATGKLLSFRNAGQAPEIMLQMLQDGLKKWDALPETEKQPSEAELKFGKIDPRFAPVLPKNAIVLKQYTRLLEKGSDGKYEVSKQTHTVGGKEIPVLVQRDFAWITEKELQPLLTPEPKVGQTLTLPKSLVYKFLRFHFMDSTRGEPDFWKLNEVREHQEKVTLTTVTAENLSFELLAKAKLAAGDKRGFDLQWQGKLTYDRKKKEWSQFDLLVMGDHTGEGTYTKNAKPGTTVVGISLSLYPVKENLIPPQGWKTGMYNMAERE